MGIDLGTASVVIYMQGKGIVLNEPSAVAYNSEGRIVGVGKKAYDMYGRNPSGIKVIKPLVNGVVADFTATKHMLEYFFSKVCKNMVLRPNVIMCVPSAVTDLEKRTLLSLASAAGAARAWLIEEPLAAALGVGLESSRPKGIMVVDIGGGTTDIAIITMGSIAISKSIQVAGNAFDEAIMRQLRRERDIIIGEKTAEQIKIKIGSATLRDVELGMTAKGKNYITNMPEAFEISSTEVFLALRPCLEMIIGGIRETLEQSTPELAADVLDYGIVLTGGGSMLRNIDKMIERKTGIKTKLASSPLNCVALGAGRAIEHVDLLSDSGYIIRVNDKPKAGKKESKRD